MTSLLLAIPIALSAALPAATQSPPAPPPPAPRPAPAEAPPAPLPPVAALPRHELLPRPEVAPHLQLESHLELAPHPRLDLHVPGLLMSGPDLSEIAFSRIGRTYAQDPADSAYREARRALNSGEWRRAASLFAGIGTRFPNSEYRADALYWQAFALYRIGGTTELREGLTALEARRTGFPNADSQSEATSLATRIRGALAARGDAAAAAALNREASRGEAACDSEELSVRSSALSALMRADPAAAQTQLERVLARQDECSVPLRKSAVMILGGKGDAASRTKLHTVATSDPSSEVRVDAIGYLGRVGGDDAAPALAQILASSNTDDRVHRAAVRALGRLSGARARAAIRTLIENASATERLRLEALSTFDQGERWGEGVEVECERDVCSIVSDESAEGVPSDASRRASGLSAEDAAWLRGLYPRFETVRLKSRAASVLVRATDDATITWLMALVQKDDEPADVRASVLARMGRSLSIAQLGRLYDTAADRTVRRQIVSTLGQRTEAEATDKLIQIVRTGTDPQLRRSAISALTRKNDPRTTQLLLEMIDR